MPFSAPRLQPFVCCAPGGVWSFKVCLLTLYGRVYCCHMDPDGARLSLYRFYKVTPVPSGSFAGRV